MTGGCIETVACVHTQGLSQPSASNTTLKDSGHSLSLPNGTVKQHCDDGRTLVRFSNGDFKRSLPDGVHCSVASDLPAQGAGMPLLPVLHHCSMGVPHRSGFSEVHIFLRDSMALW